VAAMACSAKMRRKQDPPSWCTRCRRFAFEDIIRKHRRISDLPEKTLCFVDGGTSELRKEEENQCGKDCVGGGDPARNWHVKENWAMAIAPWVNTG